MKCEKCGMRPATIRLMSINSGEKVVKNMCAICFAEVKKDLPNLDITVLDGMLANLIVATKQAGMIHEQEFDAVCAHCGTTYETFQKSGLLGCAGCYDAFREPLGALLKRIHGHSTHAGHVQGEVHDDIPQKISIYHLKQQLSRAIENEEYEHAAELRDRIKIMQRELNTAEQEAHVHDGL